MQVQDAMISEIKSCSANASLEDIARLMWDNDIGAVPVVSDDYRPVGIITDRDIAMCAMHQHRPLWEIQASQLIEGQNLCCCQPDEAMDSCLSKMEKYEVRRILVTTPEGKLCGIISLGDIAAFTREAQGGGKRSEALTPNEALELLKNVSAHHPPRGGEGQRPSSVM